MNKNTLFLMVMLFFATAVSALAKPFDVASEEEGLLALKTTRDIVKDKYGISVESNDGLRHAGLSGDMLGKTFMEAMQKQGLSVDETIALYARYPNKYEFGRDSFNSRATNGLVLGTIFRGIIEYILAKPQEAQEKYGLQAGTVNRLRLFRNADDMLRSADDLVIAGKTEQAFAAYDALASIGHPGGHMRRMIIYFRGLGVPRDKTKADDAARAVRQSYNEAGFEEWDGYNALTDAYRAFSDPGNLVVWDSEFTKGIINENFYMPVLAHHALMTGNKDSLKLLEKNFFPFTADQLPPPAKALVAEIVLRDMLKPRNVDKKYMLELKKAGLAGLGTNWRKNVADKASFEMRLPILYLIPPDDEVRALVEGRAKAPDQQDSVTAAQTLAAAVASAQSASTQASAAPQVSGTASAASTVSAEQPPVSAQPVPAVQPVPAGPATQPAPRAENPAAPAPAPAVQPAASYPPLTLGANGKPRVVAHRVSLDKGVAELALQVLAPGKTIEAVRIDNVGGVSSLWRSDGRDGSAPLSVSGKGQKLADGTKPMGMAAGEGELLLSLFLKDNGAFAGKATEFRVTVFFAGGERAMCLLATGDFPAVAAAPAQSSAPALAALPAPTASAAVLPASVSVVPAQDGSTSPPLSAKAQKLKLAGIRDFNAFFNAYAELGKKEQMEYVLYPFKMVSHGMNENTGYTVNTEKALSEKQFASATKKYKSIILNVKELRKAKCRYEIHKINDSEMGVGLYQDTFWFDDNIFVWTGEYWGVQTQVSNDTGI